MTTTPLLQPAVSGTPAATARPGRRVTDAPTRMFHWLFALSFAGAYATAEGEAWRALHVTLGYTLAGLLVFRLVYGLVGPRPAGLGLLWRKVTGAPAWLRSAWAAMRSPSAAPLNWRHGQNLLMALAILALLVLVLPLTVSGYATYNDWGDVLGGDWIGEVHEFFGNTLLVVALAHVALIAGLSLLRRKNQALPMLTGRIEGNGPDLVPSNRGWLAALLLAAVVGFAAWEWQQAPQGLIPAQLAAGASHVDRDGDDD